jgi:phosphoglycolate phosphatase-like HAD superfamily hydrolase
VKVALDLDGTLITCEPRQSAVLAAALAACRQTVNVARVWEFKRVGASTERGLVAAGLSHESAQEVAREWRRMIEESEWLALDRVIPGVRETLENMREMSMRLTLLTARGRQEWVPQQLRRLDLARFFEMIAVVSPERASAEKADRLADGSIRAFFGDTESDWRAASQTGATFYAVATGQREKSFLAQKCGVRAYDDLAEAWSELRPQLDGQD